MLIDTGSTIAFKCPSCGSFEFFSISIFALDFKDGQFTLCCHCNHSNMKISKDNLKNYKISIPCIGCGNNHKFNISRNDILFKDINVFCCPQTGIQQCFIGKDDIVRKKIDSLEKEFDELMNMFGYDNYFENTQVMLDSLNKIHDIAEKGNLNCECGNSDIELLLLSDKILLKCKKCYASKVINAASNVHLKEILLKQNILLLKELFCNNVKHKDSYILRSDEK